MAYTGLTLPLPTTYTNAAVIKRLDYRPVADNTIGPALVAVPADAAYLREFEIMSLNSSALILTMLTGSTAGTGDPILSGPQLTNQFERNWVITISDGTDTYRFDAEQFNHDSATPYIWTAIVQTAINNARDAVANFGNVTGVTIELDDGKIRTKSFSIPSGVEMRALFVVESGTPAGNEIFDTQDNRGRVVEGDNIAEDTNGGNGITLGRMQRALNGSGFIFNKRGGDGAFNLGFITGGNYDGAMAYFTLDDFDDPVVSEA